MHSLNDKQGEKGAKISFWGFSKGGAEAAANALATDNYAIDFNPATVDLLVNELTLSLMSSVVTS